MSRSEFWAALVLLLLLGAAPRALAHQGPPFAVIVDRPVGPYVLSVWTDPDVGVGTFFVILDPPPHGRLPGDIKVEVTVQPVSGRLPEARYPARRQQTRQHEQYLAQVQFDAEEKWRVHIGIQSSAGYGETTTEVLATPPGFGAWDLVWYLFPFLAVGYLWVKAALRRR